MGNRNASMAGQRETVSEKKGQRETVSEKKGDGNPLLTDSEDSLPDSEDWLTDSEDFLEFAAHLNVDSPSAADLYGHFGVMAVLFETPSIRPLALEFSNMMLSSSENQMPGSMSGQISSMI